MPQCVMKENQGGMEQRHNYMYHLHVQLATWKGHAQTYCVRAGTAGTVVRDDLVSRNKVMIINNV